MRLPRLPPRFLLSLQLPLHVPGRGLGDLPQGVGAELLADPVLRRGSSGALCHGAEEDPLVEGVWPQMSQGSPGVWGGFPLLLSRTFLFLSACTLRLYRVQRLGLPLVPAAAAAAAATAAGSSARGEEEDEE